MKKHLGILFGITLLLGFFVIPINAHALSPETEVLLRLLERKGVITKAEANALRREVEAVAPRALDKEAIKAEIKEELNAEGGLGGIAENITISGVAEVDYQYVDHRNRANKSSDSTSDLYASTVELGIAARVNESTTANVIFKLEDMDKSGNAANNDDPNDDKPVIDEATITIFNQEKCPFYAVLGKRGQPFGNFFTHTISDPITKTAYEVATTGVTIGYAPADLYDLDLSLTAYKGEKVMDQVSSIGPDYDSDSTPGYDRTAAGYDPADDVNSYILSLSAKPMEGLTFGAAFNSEPGDDSRNNTLNAFAEFSIAGLTLDGEYFAATKREKYVPDSNKTYKEKAWVIGAAYQVVDPLELAVRYEEFDNDHDTDTDGDFDYTLGLGANYQLLENVTLMGEYRRLVQQTAAAGTYEDTVNEYNLRVAIGF